MRWYHSSPKVRRGFCGTCGAVLFWDPMERGTIAIAMGAFDTPTNTHIAVNVFTRERGDYYDLDANIPTFNP